MKFNREGKLPNNAKLPVYVPQGVKEALAILDREIKKGKESKFLVYYDPDIDGLMAGLIIQDYLEKLGYEVEYKLNSNRAHGFLMDDDELKKYQGYTIIAVDFSIVPEVFDKILMNGCNLINIDHHEIDEKAYNSTNNIVFKAFNKENYGVIINNQYKTEPEEFRFLSGAGMVFYFVSYISKIYDVDINVDYVAMTGLSLLSDIRATESNEAFSFLSCLYNLNTEYMKYLQWAVSRESRAMQRFEPFGIPTMNRNFIDFTFSPLINSLLRADKGVDALKILKGDDATYLAYKANDTLYSYREIQKDIIAKIMEFLKEEQEKAALHPNIANINKKYNTMSVCALPDTFVPYPTYNITNYIGVACSKIKDEDKTGVIFVEDAITHQIKRGSVRGGIDGVNYLDIFQKNGVPCAGHQGAFGILPCNSMNIPFDKIDKDIYEAEKSLKSQGKSTRQIIDVPFLTVFLAGPKCKEIAYMNTMVRDNHRTYLRYTGDESKIKKKETGKVTTYLIEEVAVKCFDVGLEVCDGLILPIYGNKNFLECTLRKKFDF